MIMKNQIFLGLIGPIASGKGFAGKHIEKKYGFKRIVMGDLIRAVARKKHVKPTREHLRKFQKEYTKKYGRDYFINLAIKKGKESGKKRIAIDGLRYPEQARVAKKNSAIIILFTANPEIRFKREKERGRTGAPQTFQEFKKQEAKEWKIFHFKKTIEYADYIINNDGTPQELYKKVDALMMKILKFSACRKSRGFSSMKKILN